MKLHVDELQRGFTEGLKEASWMSHGLNQVGQTIGNFAYGHPIQDAVQGAENNMMGQIKQQVGQMGNQFMGQAKGMLGNAMQTMAPLAIGAMGLMGGASGGANAAKSVATNGLAPGQSVPMIPHYVGGMKMGSEKTASLRTFAEIQKEANAEGHQHHLRLKCASCGTEQTCRCSAPKTHVEGICYKCAEDTGVEKKAFVGGFIAGKAFDHFTAQKAQPTEPKKDTEYKSKDPAVEKALANPAVKEYVDNLIKETGK